MHFRIQRRRYFAAAAGLMFALITILRPALLLPPAVVNTAASICFIMPSNAYIIGVSLLAIRALRRYSYYGKMPSWFLFSMIDAGFGATFDWGLLHAFRFPASLPPPFHFSGAPDIRFGPGNSLAIWRKP